MLTSCIAEKIGDWKIELDEAVAVSAAPALNETTTYIYYYLCSVCRAWAPRFSSIFYRNRFILSLPRILRRCHSVNASKSVIWSHFDFSRASAQWVQCYYCQYFPLPFLHCFFRCICNASVIMIEPMSSIDTLCRTTESDKWRSMPKHTNFHNFSNDK